MFSILLVEDEKLELETLRDYVDWKKLGASKVYTARNGRTALECLEEHEPDIMITDIQLPVMDGIELTKRAREEGFQCKIVFLTGYDYFDYIKSAFQVQAVDYILKPFSVDEVEALILRIKEQLKKERMAENSMKFASDQIFVMACEGEDVQKLRELSAKYLALSADEKAFGFLSVYGTKDDKVLSSLLEFAEVRHAFYLEEMILVVLRGYVSFKDAAGRISAVLEEKGSVAYFEEKISLVDMKRYTEILGRYKDRMFYGKPGDIVRITGEKPIYGNRFDRDAWNRGGQKIRQEITAGNEDGLYEALTGCMSQLQCLGREECQREAYGLYLNLYNRLELDNASLMGEMEKREKKPELLIWDAGFFSEVQEALWQYVKALCAYFVRQKENPNYYVATWVRDYLEKNYMHVCSVEEMAEGIHLSPNYLRSLFKAGTGQTILEYMTDFRLRKACEFLKDKSLKVKDVSLMVGYENVSYFSQIFVKRYGVTPNEYRRMV